MGEVPTAIRKDTASTLLRHVNQQFSEHLQSMRKAENATHIADSEGTSLVDEANLRSYGSDRHLFKLQLLDDPVMEALHQVLPKVQPLVKERLGSDCILIECSVLIVDPNSPCQSLHADTIWTPSCETIAIFVALQDVTADMGPTLMLPQTHSDPSYWQKAIKESETLRLLDDAEYLQEVLSTPPLKACTVSSGTAMVMDTRLLHCGGANCSAARRTLLYLTFTKSKDFQELPSENLLEDGVNLDADPDIRRIANTQSYRELARALHAEYGDMVTLQGLMKL